MSKYIDVSLKIFPDITRWPNSSPIKFQRTLDLDHGDVANDTTIEMSVHTGTHIDAPLHFIPNGKSVEQMPLDTLVGKVWVIDLSEPDKITAEILENSNIPLDTERLLIRTSNSQLWDQNVQEFQPNFVALTKDAAQWVVDRGIKLVGIDYLSIQRFYDSSDTHLILLNAEVIIIEGLNLTNVETGEYQLICLPLKLEGVEGAPARVILEQT